MDRQTRFQGTSYPGPDKETSQLQVQIHREIQGHITTIYWGIPEDFMGSFTRKHTLPPSTVGDII
jgi:hypothetical protein